MLNLLGDWNWCVGLVWPSPVTSIFENLGSLSLIVADDGDTRTTLRIFLRWDVLDLEVRRGFAVGPASDPPRLKADRRSLMS